MEVYEIKRKIKQKNEWIYNNIKKNRKCMELY